MFNLLTAQKRKFANYASTATFKKLVKQYKGNLSTEYPHYGFLLNWKIKPTLEWHSLTDHGGDSLNDITDDIFGYLESADLKNLNRAAKSV